MGDRKEAGIGYPVIRPFILKRRPGEVAKSWKYPMCRSNTFLPRRAQQTLDLSEEACFLNLFGAAKVGCNRRARSTSTFDG